VARVLSTPPRDGDFHLVQAGEWDEREKPFAMMYRREVQVRIVLYVEVQYRAFHRSRRISTWYCYSTAQTSLTSNLI
jgi:hypothetical protein